MSVIIRGTLALATIARTYWPFQDSYVRSSRRCEPFWPNGKALYAGKQKDVSSTPLRLSFLFNLFTAVMSEKNTNKSAKI